MLVPTVRKYGKYNDKLYDKLQQVTLRTGLIDPSVISFLWY